MGQRTRLGNYLYYIEECFLEMPHEDKTYISLSHTQGVPYINALPLGLHTATFLTNTYFFTNKNSHRNHDL